jgi:hypothetical protein
MAEEKHSKDETVTKKVTAKPATEHPVKEVVAQPHRSRQWVIGIVAAVVALYVVIVIGGLWLFHVVNNRAASMGGVNQHTSMMGYGDAPGQVSGQQTFTQTATTSDGLTSTSTTTTYTQTQGVVTAVNGDSIIVAGGGKTQTIKTTSSTAYVNNMKPAVNDTVVIIGTKDGNTITATQVGIYN